MTRFLRCGFALVPGMLGSACTSDAHSLGGDQQSQVQDGGQDPGAGDGFDAGLPSSGGGGASGSPPVGGASGSPSTGGGGGASAGAGGVGSVVDGEIYECPGAPLGPAPQSDPVQIRHFAIAGDRILFEVSYSGGCRDHSFGLCYGGLGMSNPAYAPVFVLHDADGDSCEALITEMLTFDLTPLREAYLAQGGLLSVEAWSRDSTGDAVSAGRDLYRAGELGCEDRTFAAEWDTRNMEPPNTDCTTTADCQWASRDTVCSRVCGNAVSAAGASELSSVLQAISEETCGDFEADGCELPEYGPCQQQSFDCVDGQCLTYGL